MHTCVAVGVQLGVPPPPPYSGPVEPPHATAITSPPATTTCTRRIRPPRFESKATVLNVDTPETPKGPQSDALRLPAPRLLVPLPLERVCGEPRRYHRVARAEPAEG